MDVFNLCPEELSALAFAISITLAKQYTEDDHLEILSCLYSCIGDNLALIQAQRDVLIARAEAYKSSKSNS